MRPVIELKFKKLQFVHLIYFLIGWSPEDDENGSRPLLLERSIPAIHPWLLGYHLIKSKETEVVLTSSAADALIALQNLSVPVLCLPAGW